MTKNLKQILSYALLFCFMFSMIVVADEKEEIKREIDNWKRRYKQDLSKLKSKLQQLKEKQAHQTKTLPHQFDRLLDKYLKEGSEPVTWLNFLSPKNRIKFYGFLRLDIVYDSHRTNSGSTALFVNNHNSPFSDQDEELNIHARSTRIGMKIKGGKLSYIGNPEVSGKLEFDFGNGGSESRNRLRPRQAHVQLDWKEWDLMLRAGQQNDIIAPLNPGVLESFSNVRHRGNPGSRRPGLTLAYTPTLGETSCGPVVLDLKVGIYRPSTIGRDKDADVDGNNDGEDSALPVFQWRTGLSVPFMAKKHPIKFGLYGAHGWEETQTKVGINREDNFSSLLLGIDVKVPLYEDKVVLSGEWWWGHNLDDFHGGINQGIDSFHGKEIESTGGWISLKVKPINCFSFAFGYLFDNPQDEDVEDFGATGRRFNQTLFLNNVWNLGSGVSIGYEYQYMLTYYNRTDGSNYNNRGIFFIKYSF